MSGQFTFTKIIVSDVDAVAGFYREVFGLCDVHRVRQGEGEGELDEIIMGPAGEGPPIPGLVVQRYPNRPVPAPGEATLGFVVHDLDAVVASATRAGATVTRAPETQAQHGVRVAFIKDPDGHLVEIVQMLQPAAA